MSNINSIYESLLNLPTLRVDSVTLPERKVSVACHTSSGSGICLVCKQAISKVNQSTSHLIRDLSIANREVTLKLSAKQYECVDYLRKSLRREDPKQQAYKPLKWVLYKQYHTLSDS